MHGWRNRWGQRLRVTTFLQLSILGPMTVYERVKSAPLLFDEELVVLDHYLTPTATHSMCRYNFDQNPQNFGLYIKITLLCAHVPLIHSSC